MVSPPPRTDPLAGTVAMPMVPARGEPAPGRTQALEATPAAGRTQSLDAMPAAGRTQSLGALEAPLASADPQPDTPFDPRTEPASTPAPAGQAPAQDSLPPLQDLASSSPAPRRVRPLEIFLIVATCGLYGLVMLMRQRKAP
jgi:hypothetical protein